MKKTDLIKAYKELFNMNPDMNMPGIYLIYEKGTTNYYVGQTKGPIKFRLISHMTTDCTDETSIDGAINAKGIDAFEYIVLDPMYNPTSDQLDYKEGRFIEIYNSLNEGYNKTKGNHTGKHKAKDGREVHIIPMSVTRIILNTLENHTVKDQRVLLIGAYNREFLGHVYHEAKDVKHIDTYYTKKHEYIFGNMFNEEMENMENKDFDIIISNPPYGKVGCEITKRIIDEVDFREFVNLLPANDYIKRGKKYNLWQYVENVKQMVQVTGWKYFKDAAVTTHIAKITKNPNLYISADEFEIENFIDPQLTKFFYENNKREHYAIDKAPAIGYGVNNAGIWDVKTTIIIGQKDMHNCKMPIGDYASYNWNVEESIDMDFIINNKVSKSGQIQMSDIHVKTSTEKKNFVKFMYSKDGHEFYAKMWASMNIDGGVKPIGLIKVDWTKEWTVEEILKDYGYTDKEIKEVMEDIHNYRNRRK